MMKMSGGELRQRNKYFDPRGSIFGLSTETPIVVQDQSDEGCSVNDIKKFDGLEAL